ncbi:hypothetical protein GCM10027436_81920 [Actinophytocola sediminis]
MRHLTRTRSEIGRANRARGIATERDLARYLRFTGWPAAERKPDPGWSTVDRSSPDTGDIRNTPGLCWQVKSTPELTGEKLATAMRQAADQAVAGAADYGIVVHRRAGKASPGLWWAYLSLGDLAALLTGQDGLLIADPVRDAPVRLALTHLVQLLRRAGYGTRAAA